MEASERINQLLSEADDVTAYMRSARLFVAEEQFRADLAEAYLTAGTPQEVANATYSLAYRQGHSGGYSEIESFYADIAELTNAITKHYA